MSAQQMDVRKSWDAIRRNRRVVIVAMVLGLAAGLGLGLVFPPMVTAKALVALPPPPQHKGKTVPQDIETQVLIADSAPVLASAGGNVQPHLTTRVVKKRVKVEALSSDVIEVRAEGPSAHQAEDLANAVARTYIKYVTESDSKLPKDLGQRTGTRLLDRASSTTGGGYATHLTLFGLLGALGCAVLGALGVLATARSDERLRLRDEIADSVGIPVLASMSASRTPRNVSGWTRLLDGYQPSAVDAWSLRMLLHRLGVDPRAVEPVSVAVVSFGGDTRALLLGPQLAAFATSIGIPTTLMVDTQHESTTSLIAANQVAITAGDPDSVADLRIIVTVVDRDAPTLVDTQPALATVVSVSAGSVTAEDLARLAVEAANQDRDTDGIVVVDPEPTDHTTGRIPQVVRRNDPDLRVRPVRSIRGARR